MNTFYDKAPLSLYKKKEWVSISFMVLDIQVYSVGKVYKCIENTVYLGGYIYTKGMK